MPQAGIHERGASHRACRRINDFPCRIGVVSSPKVQHTVVSDTSSEVECGRRRVSVGDCCGNDGHRFFREHQQLPSVGPVFVAAESDIAFSRVFHAVAVGRCRVIEIAFRSLVVDIIMSLLLLDKDELVCFAAFLSVAEVVARLFDVGRRHVEEIGILLFSLCAFCRDEELDEFDIHLIVLVVDSHLRQIAAADLHCHILGLQALEFDRLAH